MRKRRRPPSLVGSPVDTWLDAPRRGSLSGGCYQGPSLRVHWKPRHVVATDRRNIGGAEGFAAKGRKDFDSGTVPGIPSEE